MIPFSRPSVSGQESSFLRHVLESTKWSGDGPWGKKCEALIEDQLDVNHALLTPSCTAALEMAMLLADIQPGDEVIMPSWNFPSAANAVALRGGIPVFVDVDPTTLNIDGDLIGDAVTSKTKACVVVHYAGVPCDMDKIKSALPVGCFLIEDAAQAYGATYKGRKAGTIGHVGCFSFHDTKNLTCGEGGALVTNHEALWKRAEIIREKGTDRSQFLRGEVDKYTWVDLGSSYLMSEFQAAVLYGQLEQAESIALYRHRLFRGYGYDPHESSAHHICWITIPHRDTVLTRLRDLGIHATTHFQPLHSSKAGQKYGRISGSMQHTEYAAEHILRLPLYNSMTLEDVDRVCEALESALSTL